MESPHDQPSESPQTSSGRASRPDALRQLAISYGVTNTLVFLLSRAWATERGLHQLIGAVFLFAALASIRRDDDDTVRYGVSLGGLFPGAAGDDRSLVRTILEGVGPALRELGAALGVAAVVLPVYTLFWPFFNAVPTSRSLVVDLPRLQGVLVNLLAVGLTEEVYFRGYVLTRLSDALGPGTRLRGPVPLASLAGVTGARAVPIALGAMLFAATHLTVAVTLPRAVVFFPALLFSVVRLWRGGVGAAIWLHAIFNVYSSYLEGA